MNIKQLFKVFPIPFLIAKRQLDFFNRKISDISIRYSISVI